MRLIDADALKITDTFALANGGEKPGKVTKITFAPLRCVLKRDIDNAPTVEERQGEWIPVSEKLPKYNKTVLISVKQIGKEARVFTAQRRKRFKTPDIFECCTDNDGWWDFRISAWDNHEVLAWMPLPEPYKEGGADMRGEGV